MKEQKLLTRKTRIRLNGGEPFLHPNIHHFVTAIKDASKTEIGIFTNGFWVTNENDILAKEHILKELDFLLLSVYPDKWCGRPGVIKKIKEIVPRVVTVRRESFVKFKFLKKPLAKVPPCGIADCPHLMPDGRMMRCPVGYSIFCNKATKQFAESKDLFYDLTQPKRNFQTWRKKYPMDACRYCLRKTVKHTF